MPLSWQDVQVGNPLSYGTLPDDLTQAREEPLLPAALADELRTSRFHAATPDDDQRDTRREPRYETPQAPDSKRIAVLVSHGMGQQLPFETLHAVAEGIWNRHTGAGLRVDDLRVRYVTFGKSWRPRVELTLSNAPPDSQEQATITREVHLYEAYWAPVTEGEAGIRDVFAFLLGAAKRGVRYGLKGFGRYMFGTYQTCALTRAGSFFLRFTRMMLSLLAIAFVGFWVAAITQWGAALHVPEWRVWAVPMTWLVPVTAGVVIVAVSMVVSGISFALAAWSKALSGPARRGIRMRALAMAIALVVLGLAVGATLPLFARMVWLRPRGFALAAVILSVALVAWYVNAFRELVVQYVGDVTIYVSSHTVSRFSRVRETIQSIGRSLARDVFGAYDLKTGELVYDEVVVVGHSLGSVIAYDMLNDSIQRDLELANRLRKWSNVVGRTRLLLTAGSPLDKTAFLFRTQADALATREALAAATQPMIRDYGLRPANWVNLWSPWDWISGSLQYYDVLGVHPPDSRAVMNKVDIDAPLFVAGAHTGYWERPLMRKYIYDAVWS